MTVLRCNVSIVLLSISSNPINQVWMTKWNRVIGKLLITKQATGEKLDRVSRDDLTTVVQNQISRQPRKWVLLVAIELRLPIHYHLSTSQSVATAPLRCLLILVEILQLRVQPRMAFARVEEDPGCKTLWIYPPGRAIPGIPLRQGNRGRREGKSCNWMECAKRLFWIGYFQHLELSF